MTTQTSKKVIILKMCKTKIPLLIGAIKIAIKLIICIISYFFISVKALIDIHAINTKQNYKSILIVNYRNGIKKKLQEAKPFYTFLLLTINRS